MSEANLFQIKVMSSLLEISQIDWQPLQVDDFPFMDYAFLSTLEQTRCLGKRTGWSPIYITAWRESQLVGALVLYQKNNSYGEFIFDFGWAEAAYSAGIEYYPKLIAAIPFTPVTGPKMVAHPQLSAAEKTRVAGELFQGARDLIHDLNVSSLHFLFIPEEEADFYRKNNFFIRHSFQYHWKNNNYTQFADFLAALKGKRRREISRERDQVKKQGIRIKWLTGSQLTPEYADLMHSFYLSTMDKKQGIEFLTRDFFRMIFQRMNEKILFVVAYDTKDLPVAGALNFIGTRRLFGRYWGCLDEYRALHFEVCYYQGIDYCLQNHLKIFEAGAQGEHKFNRGFLPTLTFSSHRIVHPGLNHAVQDFVEREKQQLKLMFADYDEHCPYHHESRLP